jgi:predicted RNA-binding protein
VLLLYEHLKVEKTIFLNSFYFFVLGGLQHFIEYPTAQLLQAQQQQQQQQQPQFIQHNGQLVQVIRAPMGYSSANIIQQLQLQQQQQQFAAQIQAQQIAAMQQSGGAIFLQNSAGQLVLAQPSQQAMRVVQFPYGPK